MTRQRFQNIALALTAILGLAACSTEEEVAPVDDNIVKISATIGSQGAFGRSNPLGTAEEQAKFNVGDAILVKANTGDRSYSDNVTYTFNGTDWVAQDGKFLIWKQNTLDFDAAYPASIAIGGLGETFVGNLPTDQSTMEKIAGADLMVGDNYGKAKADVVTFSMSRLTSRVIVKIASFNNEFDAATAAVTDVKFVTTPYGGGTANEYLPYAQGSGSAGSTYTALLPSNAYYGTLAVSMTVGGKTLTAPIPLGEQGKSYTYNLTVGKNKIEVGSVIIDDWTTGTTLPGGEAMQEISFATGEVVTSARIAAAVNAGVLKIGGAVSPEQFAVVCQYLRDGTAPAVTRLDISRTTGITAISSYVDKNDGSDETWNLSFGGNTTLQQVNLPTTVTTLVQAFQDCTALTSVTGLDMVTTDKYFSFSGCTALKQAPYMPRITSLANSFIRSGITEFSSSTVSSLEGQVFADCAALTRVDCPKAEYLQNELFEGCASLTEIRLTSPTFTKVRSFLGSDGLTHYDPFTGIVNKANVSLYLAAEQAAKITKNGEKWEWKPFDSFDTSSYSNINGMKEVVDLTGFKTVICGTTVIY